MPKIDYVIEYISVRNFIHTKKLKNLAGLGEIYAQRVEEFLTRYESLLAKEGRNLDFAIDSYLKMLADFNFELLRFRETGQYTSKSFAEVNSRVYANPAVMEYYMHGLLLSQFLWKHHYEMFCFFSEELTKRRLTVKDYLEIGGGHGLQVAEAATILGEDSTLTVVDISTTSLEIARQLVANDRVHFTLSDIFQYNPGNQFDFITIGEVLEHMEDPGALLRYAGRLLTEEGTVFVTTPANAPAIDHIYLFRNAEDIRHLIHEAGFTIASEFTSYAEDLPLEVAEKHKVTLHYGATLKKKVIL